MNAVHEAQATFETARMAKAAFDVATPASAPNPDSLTAVETALDESKKALSDELEGFYNDLGGFDPDPVKMLETGRALAEVFKPHDISMDHGVKEQIVEAVRAKRSIVFCPNHVRAEDQYILIGALLAQQEPEFTNIIEHIRIMFKVEYAEGKDNQAIGFGPEELIPLGGIPVTRPIRDGEVADMAKKPFNKMMDELSSRDNHFIGFYESTRNQGIDPHTIQTVREGAGHFAIRAAQHEERDGKELLEPSELFIPVGISYTPYVDPRFAPANIHFGSPVTFESPDEVAQGSMRQSVESDDKKLVRIFTFNLAKAMQGAVNSSIPTGQLPLFNAPLALRRRS